MKQSKLKRWADIYLAGGVGAGIFIFMICAAIFSFLYTVLSCEIWMSSFNSSAFAYSIAWAVLTLATVWLARRCYYIVMKAKQEAARLNLK